MEGHHSFIYSSNKYLSSGHDGSSPVPDIGVVEVNVAQFHLTGHILVKETDIETNIFKITLSQIPEKAFFHFFKSLSVLWLSSFYSHILGHLKLYEVQKHYFSLMDQSNHRANPGLKREQNN